MELYEKIVALLKETNTDYTELRHAPVRTSEEASLVRGTPLHEGAKALIVVTEKESVLVVVPGNKKVNMEEMKKRLTSTKAKMASPEQAERITGAQVGGIAPFGNLFALSIPTYCDRGVLSNNEIEFNAGDRGISIRMKAKDWESLVHPIIGDFARNDEIV